MKTNTIIVLVVSLSIVAGWLFYFNRHVTPALTPGTTATTAPATTTPEGKAIPYTNNKYGFTFALPNTWQGYTIVNTTWQGTAATTAVATSGPKILIRNPKWTATVPYEDLPILVFTTQQWSDYMAQDFFISAAPIPATELAHNDRYVFALPPRWDFDYSLGYQEAEAIMASQPLRTFVVTPTSTR